MLMQRNTIYRTSKGFLQNPESLATCSGRSREESMRRTLLRDSSMSRSEGLQSERWSFAIALCKQHRNRSSTAPPVQLPCLTGSPACRDGGSFSLLQPGVTKSGLRMLEGGVCSSVEATVNSIGASYISRSLIMSCSVFLKRAALQAAQTAGGSRHPAAG